MKDPARKRYPTQVCIRLEPYRAADGKADDNDTMLILNLAIALIVALPLWYFGSWLLARAIFRAETRNPHIVERASWPALESGLTLAVFVASVAVWLGLTYLLQQVIK